MKNELRQRLPVLYTFKRCPYAIRARMALYYAGISIEQQEVDLKNKPLELIKISPKATVPVLVWKMAALLIRAVIIKWALEQSDPDGRMNKALEKNCDRLIDLNDYDFKIILITTSISRMQRYRILSIIGNKPGVILINLINY